MITEEDRKKYPYHTEDSILGVKLIQGLRNDVLRTVWDEYINLDKNVKMYLKSIRMLIGDNTNLNWIAGRVAEEMFERDMIDEDQFYDMQEKCS